MTGITKYTKLILLCVLFWNTRLVGFAQKNCSIVNAYAFYNLTSPGMPMVDDKGNTVSLPQKITRFIYLEWNSIISPEVDKVVYDNKSYTAIASIIKSNKVIPGVPEDSNHEYSIIAKKCNTLWKLELQPINIEEIEKPGATSIIIFLKKDKNDCKYYLSQEKLISTHPSY